MAFSDGAEVLGSVLRIERYIYIFCVLPHLESTPLGRVQNQEAFKEVLAVCGHVERDAVLSSEHALTQLLQTKGERTSSWNNSGCGITIITVHMVVVPTTN